MSHFGPNITNEKTSYDSVVTLSIRFYQHLYRRNRLWKPPVIYASIMTRSTSLQHRFSSPFHQFLSFFYKYIFIYRITTSTRLKDEKPHGDFVKCLYIICFEILLNIVLINYSLCDDVNRRKEKSNRAHFVIKEN